MDLSVIVVTWNSEKYIAQCLHSCAKAAPGIEYEIIVVDNASSDRTAEIVRTQFPHVQMIALSSNEGFARACNRGVHLARGQHLCFVNPDTEVLGGSLAHMTHFLQQRPHAGIVGGRLKNSDGSTQPSVRAFLTPSIAYGIACKLHRVPLCKKLFARYFMDYFDYSSPQKVEQVMGAFFAISRDLMHACGGFDERYFIWFEEVDLMREAIRRGKEVWYYPKAIALHAQAQSFHQVEARVNQERFIESMACYIEKWYGALAAAPLRIGKPFILLFYSWYMRARAAPWMPR